jgi:hypothetical protein
MSHVLIRDRRELAWSRPFVSVFPGDCCFFRVTNGLGLLFTETDSSEDFQGSECKLAFTIALIIGSNAGSLNGASWCLHSKFHNGISHDSAELKNADMAS